MTTTGTSSDTNKLPDEGEPVDSTQVPDVVLEDVAMPETPERPSRRHAIDELSDEERTAVEQAAAEMSIEEILAPGGVNAISRRVTGKDVALPIGVDGPTLLDGVRDTIGGGLEILGRGLDAAGDRVGTLADRLRRSAENESEKKE